MGKVKGQKNEQGFYRAFHFFHFTFPISRFTFPVLFFLFAFCGCSSVFFYPTPFLYQRPESFGLRYETVKFPSLDGTEITGLILFSSSAPARGTVIQFH